MFSVVSLHAERPHGGLLFELRRVMGLPGTPGDNMSGKEKWFDGLNLTRPLGCVPRFDTPP